MTWWHLNKAGSEHRNKQLKGETLKTNYLKSRNILRPLGQLCMGIYTTLSCSGFLTWRPLQGCLDCSAFHFRASVSVSVSVETEPPKSSWEKRRRCHFLPVLCFHGIHGMEIPGWDKRPAWVSALILLYLFKVGEGRITWEACRKSMLNGSGQPSRGCPSQKLCLQRPERASRIPSFHINHSDEENKERPL